MAYEKIGFKSGDKLKAEHLNHMEDGIIQCIPIKGVDYWTDADREAIVQQVIAALPVYNGEVV
jgi:hypothetical protein